MPLVSIIIPTYNRAHLVGDAIRSALDQRYPDREVIVADDGSTDETPNVVRHFGEVIRYDWQPNAGVAAARNRGAAIAQGDYLCFLDSDDILRQHAIERLAELLDAHPEAGMAYGQTEQHEPAANVPRIFQPPFRRPSGVWMGGDELEHLLLGNYIHTGAVLMRREAFESTGGFREDFDSMAEDWDLWVRLAGQWSVAYAPDVMETMRFQPGGLTTRMDAEHVTLFLRNWRRIVDTGLDTPNGRALPTPRGGRADAFALYKAAHLAYATHDTSAARETMAHALALWPRLLLDPETREVRRLWLKLKVPEPIMERARASKQ